MLVSILHAGVHLFFSVLGCVCLLVFVHVWCARLYICILRARVRVATRLKLSHLPVIDQSEIACLDPVR